MSLWVKEEEKCHSAEMYDFLENGVSLCNGVSSWSSFLCFLVGYQWGFLFWEKGISELRYFKLYFLIVLNSKKGRRNKKSALYFF